MQKRIISALCLLGFLSWFWSGCQQEKKTEEGQPSVENFPTTSFARPSYTLGDSVTLLFAKPVSSFILEVDGHTIENKSGVKDSVRLDLKEGGSGFKPGWKQVVVRGKMTDQQVFTDTLRVELLSDLVPQEIKYNLVSSYPHLTTSFTEGLEFYNGDLYEGTGENGKSQLLKLDLKTGKVLKSINLEQQYFGEGITIVKDKIYQLTWQSGVCFRYNLDFTLDKKFTYYFQGWGLTHRDTTLMMSDGSNTIHFYNTNFEKTGDIQVYDQNGPVRKINELEYVNGFIYANLFESTKVIKIDAVSGKVVGQMDLKGIVPASVDVRKDVLNGIAYNSADKHLYFTGKNWPALLKVSVQDHGKYIGKGI